MRDIAALATQIHQFNHKWWHTQEGVRLERDPGELLMLVVSELSEAMEGIRKNLMDDKLPHRLMEEVEMADAFIRLCDFGAGFSLTFDHDVIESRDTFSEYVTKAAMLLQIVKQVCAIDDAISKHRKWRAETFLSSALSMIIDYCEQHGLDLWCAIFEKNAYNQTRKDHTWEARAEANGKRF